MIVLKLQTSRSGPCTRISHSRVLGIDSCRSVCWCLRGGDKAQQGSRKWDRVGMFLARWMTQRVHQRMSYCSWIHITELRWDRMDWSCSLIVSSCTALPWPRSRCMMKRPPITSGQSGGEILRKCTTFKVRAGQYPYMLWCSSCTEFCTLPKYIHRVVN